MNCVNTVTCHMFFEDKHTVILIQRVAYGVNPAAGVMRCFLHERRRKWKQKAMHF